MRGYCGVGLVNPKSNINVGSVLRAAGCFDAAFVAVQGKRYSKAPTDVRRQHRHTPLHQTEDIMDVVPYDCVPVAVDLLPNARSLWTYSHPERAFYIFGPEDGILGKQVTDRCVSTIYIPSNLCLNLAAAVNVVLYDRSIKRRG